MLSCFPVLLALYKVLLFQICDFPLLPSSKKRECQIYLPVPPIFPIEPAYKDLLADFGPDSIPQYIYRGFFTQTIRWDYGFPAPSFEENHVVSHRTLKDNARAQFIRK